MRYRLLLGLAALSAVAAPIAQSSTAFAAAPAAPSATQRRSILDALRPAIAQRLGLNVEFVVHDIRVSDGWAFVNADPQRRGGGRIDGRAYFGDDFDNMDGLTVTALLQFREGRWTLMDHVIGATDAWYCGLGHDQLVGC
jgi:hypothetical protein